MAAAPATSEPEVYYDPWASGDAGPHLRYPQLEGQPLRRQFFSFQRGKARPQTEEERQMVRDYLSNRGFPVDKLVGDNLPEPLRCRCGVELGNLTAVAMHQRRWPDHDLSFTV